MARNKYDIDEDLDVEFNFDQFRRLMKYLVPYRKTMIGIIIIILISNMTGFVTPLIMKNAIDHFIPEKNVKMLLLMVGLFLTMVVAGSICMKFRIRHMSRMGNNIVADIRRDLFEHIQKLPFDYFDSRPHGKIIVRVVNYVNTLSELLSNGVINVIIDIFGFFVALGIMLSMNWKLSLVIIAFVPVVILAVTILRKFQRTSLQELSSKQSNMNAYVHESISGMKVTKSFTREEVNFKIFNELMDQYQSSWMRSRVAIGLAWPITKNISSISQGAMLLVAILLLKDEVTAGAIVAFLSYTGSFWQPILNISDLYNQLVSASAYLERIFETMDTDPSIKDEENAYPLPPITGEVTFDHVTFGYEKDQVILNDINFTVKPGETIALVGPTGAGKTSIVNLISRFYDVQKGRVLIDDNDVKEVTLHSLRTQLGIMLQDSFIFSGTIMDNIRYSKLDATDEEVIEAAKAVKAHDFIIEMEEGYNTEVNERGSRLSTGQRQLISFARAILADPKILVLDEATSSIDTQTEKVIQEGLEVLLKDRTSFVIAHRLSTIKNSNRIMVINKGIIEESGTHDDLIEKKGHYYKLYEAQTKFLSQPE